MKQESPLLKVPSIESEGKLRPLTLSVFEKMAGKILTGRGVHTSLPLSGLIYSPTTGTTYSPRLLPARLLAVGVEAEEASRITRGTDSSGSLSARNLFNSALMSLMLLI